jgi:YVTN family beta-propeller protein
MAMMRIACATMIIAAATRATVAAGEPIYLSPSALVAAPDGKTLFIACAAANEVALFSRDKNQITRRIRVPASPSGLALSRDARRLYVTCAAPQSTVCVLDATSGKTLARIPTGHTAMSPVLSADEQTLFVCNRFNNAVAVIDLAARKEIAAIEVQREPVAAALTPDGKHLFVANHIHSSRSDVDVVAATVSVMDTTARKIVTHIALPNGSTLLRGVAISPDGRHVAVTHTLARFHLPTTQLDRGWVNNNALSIIDAAELKLVNTVLLDNVDSGAANPWAVNWSTDGKFICVTHAGTHELSVIDAPALLAKLAGVPAQPDPKYKPGYGGVSRTKADVPNDLAFLVGLRQRVQVGEKGPRALALAGNMAFAANYFSDSLSVVDLNAQNLRAATVPLAAPQAMTDVRRGEFLFNDASMCFQGWQSCGSCHSSDARVDGMNWDLLNDGLGNPKNVKSLLFTHRTPPTTSLGVRANAYVSVRSGLRHILFTSQPSDVADALDEYLISLKPIPSPSLVNGKFSAAARRGEKLFSDKTVACASCHAPPLFTDLKEYDVGTTGQFDRPTDKFDNPTLVEVWRTAPYLHDGSAASMRDVLTTRNRGDRHGKTSHLTTEQINDLIAYVLSL